jgi:Na+/H+ antiporter NhaD/arsenite permease-like protein
VTPVLASAASLTWWSVVPFGAYLLAIAILPLVASHFWHSNRNRLIVSIAVAVPVAGYLLTGPEGGGVWLLHAIEEYVAFIALLGSLFVISGGIRITGSLAGTPLTNTAILGLGAVLASFIGTTGASMLLIRPLLRANETRARRAHLVIFFIFIVANSGGLLTPLGDPPLYLGFMRGVPFMWTFGLFIPWLIVNGVLLAVFNGFDQWFLHREEERLPGSQLEEILRRRSPLGIEGGLNFLWLGVVIFVIFGTAEWGPRLLKDPGVRSVAQGAVLAGIAAIAWKTTGPAIRKANGFSWSPIFEVAAIFIGIFVTMVPALKLVEAEGGRLGLTHNWQFFWATGLLSGVLDNAPTYLTFTALGASVINSADPSAGLTLDNLAPFAAHPRGAGLLAAISCGAVFMGALTYIGNGPNFMVKAIAEENGVKMPGFFGYLAWSGGILLPIFAFLTLVWYSSG